MWRGRAIGCACVVSALGALGSAPAATAKPYTRADLRNYAGQIAKPWMAIQRDFGRYPDYLDYPGGERGTRYGESVMGYALVRLGLRTGNTAMIHSGLRAMDWAVGYWTGPRRDVLQSVFENWTVAATYNLMRRRLPGDSLFKKNRGQWAAWLRGSRAERSGIADEYGNHWLVDASGVFEAQATGLHSSKSTAVLGGRRGTARRDALRLVNTRVPDFGAGGGPLVLSDPPDNPSAYQGLSLGLYAHLIRFLGPRASARARATLRRAADALWLDTAPNGDSGYYGRSQEQIWATSATAYGALVAANLKGTSSAAAARYRSLAERSLERLVAAYPNTPRGQLIVPALADDPGSGRRVLDFYAGGPSMDGIALFFLDMTIDELHGGRRLAPLAADHTEARTFGGGDGRFAVIRHGPIWFAARMRPTSHPRHYGDLRYDVGVVNAKRLVHGRWQDVVPMRPRTIDLRTDSAGPGIVEGGRLVAPPYGDHLSANRNGVVAARGHFRTRNGRDLGPVSIRWIATRCGVETLFRARPGRTYEYSAFFRGKRLPKVAGRTVSRSGRTTTISVPSSITFRRGYGSAEDGNLVRARFRFRVSQNRVVHIDSC